MVFNIIMYNLLTTTALFFLLIKNPRFMMQDYPKEITAQIPPRTNQEKRASFLYGFPFLLVLIFFPLIVGVVEKFSQQINFFDNALRMAALFFSFNLVDLLLIDWLVFCTLTPRFLVLPGTEGHPGYKNYHFHFLAFLKGILLCIFASIVFAGLIDGAYAFILILK